MVAILSYGHLRTAIVSTPAFARAHRTVRYESQLQRRVPSNAIDFHPHPEGDYDVTVGFIKVRDFIFEDSSASHHTRRPEGFIASYTKYEVTQQLHNLQSETKRTWRPFQQGVEQGGTQYVRVPYVVLAQHRLTIWPEADLVFRL